MDDESELCWQHRLKSHVKGRALATDVLIAATIACEIQAMTIEREGMHMPGLALLPEIAAQRSSDHFAGKAKLT